MNNLSVEELDVYFRADGTPQCPRGVKFILDLLDILKPSVYLETGCAHLATFKLYQSKLSADGLAIGIDIRNYPTWKEYKGNCETHLTTITTDRKEEINSFLSKILVGRKIDYLFIDGDHSENGVRHDWEALRPYVRTGGLIVFHDYDPGAVERGVRNGQGAAIICNELAKEGFQIQSVPNTMIATAYTYMI